MAAKSRKSTPDASASEPAEAESSPQNIWLAGLGALAHAQASAQAEGSKAFEALVKQGLEMQARTQALAKEQWSEAAQQLSAVTTEAGSNPWDRLGGIFQTRVARALESMGMPSADEVTRLAERVAALEETVARLQRAAPRTRKAPPKAP